MTRAGFATPPAIWSRAAWRVFDQCDPRSETMPFATVLANSPVDGLNADAMTLQPHAVRHVRHVHRDRTIRMC
jgi:hypothetical protein